MVKQKIVKILPFVFLVLALIAFISYAFLTIDFGGTKISGATRPDVSISLDEVKSINLTSNKMSDELGKTQTDYSEFIISSEGKWDGTVPVNIYIKEISRDIDNSNVKIYLTKLDNGIEKEVLGPIAISDLRVYKNDTNSYILDKGNFIFTNNEKKTYSETYRLRAWLDENTVIADRGYTTTNESDGSTVVKSNDVKYSFKINVSTKKIVSEAEAIIAKVGTGGLVAESHPATEQTTATTAYRYTGANPDNYVSFNDELWRIIGVFDVDDGTGNLEKRMKLIRKDDIGDIVWDVFGTNEWTVSSSMTLLNIGDYWNRTGSYASTGLTAEAKTMIDDAKWYLGGFPEAFTDSSNGLVNHLYGYERGNKVYNGIDDKITRSTSWIGKIGLMYPSDYGYATGGGPTVSRTNCLEKEVYGWHDLDECYNNNWLYKTEMDWTLTSWAVNSPDSGIRINSVPEAESVIFSAGLRPCVYLSSDVSISGGSGTEINPYILSN